MIRVRRLNKFVNFIGFIPTYFCLNFILFSTDKNGVHPGAKGAEIAAELRSMPSPVRSGHRPSAPGARLPAQLLQEVRAKKHRPQLVRVYLQFVRISHAAGWPAATAIHGHHISAP